MVVDTTELENSIINQIEYYFGDFNLSKDKFLKDEMTKDDGWVSLGTLLTFNKMKSLTTDPQIIVDALKKSDSNLIEINEEEKKIRRNPCKPLPEITDQYLNELNERTIHIKGFPKDSKYEDVVQFCKDFGETESIQMRYTKSKDFKGCIFVVYKQKDDALKVLGIEGLSFNGNKLLKENKNNYALRKKEFFDSLKKKTKNESQTAKWEKNSSKEEKTSPIASKNAVLKLKGVPKDIDFKQIKETFSQFGEIKFVDEANEELESFIRFNGDDSATAALEKAKIIAENEGEGDGQVTVVIGDHKLKAEVLTGEEELNYWTKLQEILSNIPDRRKKGNFRRKKWQNSSKRSNDQNHSGATQQKRIKTE